MDATALSMFRPPWLETMMPSQPYSAAFTASSGRLMPFTIRMPGHILRKILMSSHDRLSRRITFSTFGSVRIECCRCFG